MAKKTKFEKGKLALRLYGFAPYNILPVQVGIQIGHAKDELYAEYWDENPIYKEFAKFWKPYVFLDGGTSNNGTGDVYNPENPYTGSMERIVEELEKRGIEIGKFYEPDMNSMTSGIALVVDERVWDKVKYPDWNVRNAFSYPYAKWLEDIGGEKNEFLRWYLPQFRLWGK